MKTTFLLTIMAAGTLAGCSSAYKASQTPDDVYFSPAKVQGEALAKTTDNYENYIGSEDDQYLRMKVQNRNRWSTIDDYAYWNDSRYYSPTYNYGYYGNNWYGSGLTVSLFSPFYSRFSSYYSPFYSGGFGLYSGYYNPYYSYYSPYSTVYITKYPSVIQSNTNRPNLNGYLNNSYRNINQPNSRPGLGGSFRRVFSSSNNDNSYRVTNPGSYTSPTRSYTPSSSSGSSSGSRSSSPGVSRQPRH